MDQRRPDWREERSRAVTKWMIIIVGGILALAWITSLVSPPQPAPEFTRAELAQIDDMMKASGQSRAQVTDWMRQRKYPRRVSEYERQQDEQRQRDIEALQSLR